MATATKKAFLEKLKTYINMQIAIKVESNIFLEYYFNKLDFEINEDILILKDLNNKNNISFNMNNINYMEINENFLLCILNDQQDTKISLIKKV